MLEHQLGVAVEMVGVRDARPFLREQMSEPRLALLQGLRPAVRAIELEKVEGMEDRVGVDLPGVQQCEVGDPVLTSVENSNFSLRGGTLEAER